MLGEYRWGAVCAQVRRFMLEACAKGEEEHIRAVEFLEGLLKEMENLGGIYDPDVGSDSQGRPRVQVEVSGATKSKSIAQYGSEG